MQNVAALFGEAAAPEKRCSEGIVNILKAEEKTETRFKNMSVISMQSCRKVLSLHWTGTVAILRHI